MGLAERFGADDLIGGGRAPRGPRGRAPRGRAPRGRAPRNDVGVGAFVGVARFLETEVGATVEDGEGRFFMVVVLLAVVVVFLFDLAFRCFLFNAISSIIDIGFFGIGF